MNLLAIDTSSDACSVALEIGCARYTRHEVQPKEHTRILIPAIRALLAEAGAGTRDLDAIVLGNGPGSFIGMRIAASVAQGLAFGCRRKIVPVSSLAAVAAEVLESRPGSRVIVAQDARMNEVYLGTYESDDARLPIAVRDEILHPVGCIDDLARATVRTRIAAGQGWRRYPALLEQNRRWIDQCVDVHHPNAKYLLDIGAREWLAGNAVAPEELEPAYLRAKVANARNKALTEL